MTKSSFHLLDVIEHFFQPVGAAGNEINANRLLPCRSSTVSGEEIQNSNNKNNSSFDLPCANDIRQ